MKKNIYYSLILLSALCAALFMPSETKAAGKLPLKPPQRKMIHQLNKLIAPWQNSFFAMALNKTFFRTGLYRSLIRQPNPVIINRRQNFEVEKSIKIITANLMLFPPPMGENQYQRIDDFISTISPFSPDFILLQEVWGNNSLDYLASRLNQYNLVFCNSALYNRSGLVIFSRPQIIRAEFFSYPLDVRHNLEELLAQKGAILIEFKKGSQLLRVVNSHLYSSPPGRNHRPNPGQFTQLQNWLEEKQGQTTIIGGDLNLRPKELKTLLCPSYLADPSPDLTAGFPAHNQKLDHILLKPLRPGAFFRTQKIACPQPFSDHSPVLAVIRLQN